MLSDDNDQIPAVYHSLNGPKHMQHGGKAAEHATSSNPPQLMTPSKLSSSSDLYSRCCSEAPVEASALSPASVRPKQRVTPGAHQHAAYDDGSDSQCSQCLNTEQPDEGHDMAGQPEQQSRKTAKANRKAAGCKRKVRAKRQGKKAPMVMSACYAAAVLPVLEQPDEQKSTEASDR